MARSSKPGGPWGSPFVFSWHGCCHCAQHHSSLWPGRAVAWPISPLWLLLWEIPPRNLPMAMRCSQCFDRPAAPRSTIGSRLQIWTARLPTIEGMVLVFWPGCSICFDSDTWLAAATLQLLVVCTLDLSTWDARQRGLADGTREPAAATLTSPDSRFRYDGRMCERAWPQNRPEDCRLPPSLYAASALPLCRPP